MHCYVKWVGYDLKDATWETKESLKIGCTTLLEAYERRCSVGPDESGEVMWRRVVGESVEVVPGLMLAQGLNAVDFHQRPFARVTQILVARYDLYILYNQGDPDTRRQEDYQEEVCSWSSGATSWTTSTSEHEV